MVAVIAGLLPEAVLGAVVGMVDSVGQRADSVAPQAVEREHRPEQLRRQRVRLPRVEPAQPMAAEVVAEDAEIPCSFVLPQRPVSTPLP